MKTLLKTKTTLWFLLIICFACNKENPPTTNYNELDGGVFILNEGNFTYGNASLSFYNDNKKTINNEIFYNANEFPLGDVAQSMIIHNNKGYIVINNSGKITVIDINNFTHIKTISALTSPRYILPTNNNKAYVTDLYSHYISILDIEQGTITGSIYIGKSTEQIIKINDFAYTINWNNGNNIYKIDINNDTLIDSLFVGYQPNSLVKDKHNNIWILCDGGYNGSANQDTAALIYVESNNFSIKKRFLFNNLNTSPNNLNINAAGDSLFYINGSWGSNAINKSGIYTMSIYDTELPAEPLIPEKNNLFYALSINPKNSELYVSDAIDYMQKGIVFRYTQQGIKIDSFKTDIVPGSFCFKP